MSMSKNIEVPGVVLLDALLQSFSLGIIFCQTKKYFHIYLDDSRRMRAYVLIVAFLALLQTALEVYKIWRLAIQHQPWQTSRIDWSDIFLNGCICFVCQAFLIRRCWKILKKNYWVSVPLAIISSSLLAANIFGAVAIDKVSSRMPDNVNQLDSSSTLARYTGIAFTYWIFVSLALDGTMTCMLMVSLWRSRTGLQHSNKVLLQIITLAWESALLPAVSMIAAVSFYASNPSADDHFVVFFVLLTGKLYTLGLLLTLNARAKFRERLHSHDIGRTALEGWDWNQDIVPNVMSTLQEISPTTYQPAPANTDSTACSSTITIASINEDTESHFSSPGMDARERGIIKRAMPISHI